MFRCVAAATRRGQRGHNQDGGNQPSAMGHDWTPSHTGVNPCAALGLSAYTKCKGRIRQETRCKRTTTPLDSSWQSRCSAPARALISA